MRWVPVTLPCSALAALLFANGCQANAYGEDERKKPTSQTGEIRPAPRNDGGGGGGGAVVDSPVTSPTDGGVVSVDRAPDAGVNAGGACPNTAVTQTLYNWKPPPPPSSPCTAADIGFIEGQLATTEPYAKLEESMRARNAMCASCLFSIQGDSTWGPFVFYEQDRSKGAFHNAGACYAAVKGGSEKCGDEVQQWEYCLDDVCSTCAEDPAWKECRTNAKKDPATCGRFDFEKACGGPTTTLDEQCYTTWAKELTTVCGPR